MTGESHRHFHDEVTGLKERLLQRSSQAQEAVHRAVNSVLRRDVELGAEVVADDHKIDAFKVEIEDNVTNLLALHQPMARDLRLLLATLKISNDLERVADLATNIAEDVVFLVEGKTIKHRSEQPPA
jgi:phosphate transport system protein